MAGLKKLISTVSTLGRCGSLEKTEFKSFYFGKGVVVLKVLDLTVFTLGRYGSLERNYLMFLLWEGVAVLKEVILTVSTL